ncbi:acyl-[ACP]--phospholipid O-acyltransferase [Aeoliella mucimassa]|uniref:Bifunctional protein Aas n=1 Tax=Aeoliella mucimassa TaxID=2527972 RepID=A0A518ATF2_9BACT|nr:acyl-[ACP]--phospholipid O-acyltransferase [Aeoliella mucimassa]QDU57992.1 Bifunctional protein Aas [Aeoliella mucimassa]
MTDSDPEADPSTPGEQGEPHPQPAPQAGLKSATFLGLLFTQLFGATNDSITRWLVIGIGKEKFVNDSQMLVAGSVCFILPYLILAAPAGYLADRFSKRDVIIWCKIAEVVLMILTVLAVYLDWGWLLFTSVALMGAQSALFGPAKLGSIPEMLHQGSISAANGIMGFVTVLAIVFGTAIGGWLATEHVRGVFGSYDWMVEAGILVGFALIGWWTSLWITFLRPAQPQMPFPWDFPRRTLADVRILASDRALLLVALGGMFFWSLGTLSQLTIDQLVSEQGGSEQIETVPGLVSLVIGMALGSLLAGLWSNDHVELGMLPLGAGGMVLFTFLLFTNSGDYFHGTGAEAHMTYSYALACVYFAMLGLSSGFFMVPLAAYLQHRSPADVRGAILAASNFLMFAGMLVVTLGFLALRTELFTDEPLFNAREIFLMCSIVTLPVLVYIVYLIPQTTTKFIAWLLAHTVYRIHMENRDVLPNEGGALLVANHVTWVDGLLVLCSSSRPVRLMIKSDLLNTRWKERLAKLMGVIEVPTNPHAARPAIRQARRAIKNGELVCLFAEGQVTRSGQLQSFTRGLLSLVRGINAPVIPVYLDELWGSMFSYRGGKLFGRWPSRWPHRVTCWFGQPITHPNSVGQVREAVQQLGAKAAVSRHARSTNVVRTMLRTCRKARFRWKIADSTGDSLTGSQFLMRSFILRRLLVREVLASDEKNIGLLLPPSNGAAITNAALALAGRVAVNLNYSVSEEVMNACIRQAGIRQILTSRRVAEKLPLDLKKLNAKIVYLEELREKLTLGDKVLGGLHGYATPCMLLDLFYGLNRIDPDDLLTIVFTSGSTGDPKGVMLTYRNIAANVDSVDQVIQLNPNDTMLGILPFFHSFGYTITLWGPLALDIHAAYHFNPLDAKMIGKLAARHKATILLSTPTFLRTFSRRCTPDEFATLDVVVAGAEKLPMAVSDAFEERFGVRPVEGYGTTELAPLVSVNVPPSRSHHEQVDSKEGSVGRPVPGVAAKVIHPENGDDLPQGAAGMLLITGANVMKGYLNLPEKTSEVVRNGWYVTGDIARIDADGFIHITGRESRFSKIGGEMVPHIGVEEAIEQVIGIDDDDESPLVVVTAVPDEKKGERLIVVHRELNKTPDEICAALKQAGLPNIWIPSVDSFMLVDGIPVLGSGKLDLKALALLAQERYLKL